MSGNSRFKKGSGVYRCGCCGHLTRDTGGDGAGVGICDLCYDLAGERNSLSDNGEFYDSVANVKAMLAALDSRNGKACAVGLFPEVAKAAGYEGAL